MNRIYLVRHAESVANTRGLYQGQTYNTPLSPLGQLQAKALAQYLANHTFDQIFVSPLLRTLQTASLLASSKKVQPLIDRRLIEINHGHWEGISKVEVARRWPNSYLLWKNFPSQAVFPGGERFTDTYNRIISWWQDISRLEGNYLAITHDGVIRPLLAHLRQNSLDQIWDFDLQPASITVIENQQISILNHTSHLTGLMANLSLHAL